MFLPAIASAQNIVINGQYVDAGHVDSISFAPNGSGYLTITATGTTLTAPLNFSGLQADSVDLAYGNLVLDMSHPSVTILQGTMMYVATFGGTVSRPNPFDFNRVFSDFGTTNLTNAGSLASFEIVLGDSFPWYMVLVNGVNASNLFTGWEFTNTGTSLRWVNPEAPVVPEPATLALMGLGLAGLGYARARNRKK